MNWYKNLLYLRMDELNIRIDALYISKELCELDITIE